ncbi:tRNA (adenosine(37)-N6)-threonylcarbamoyltransferase complex ATPase subunit type 1 TsaE [Porifericola rhodea]|uniref:tRNA (adenosine(37)-N6)-threonylcarbamoyltransferase complex ATPase subunit type 1 TsaE n=1 Tax=Porifericola rhodea TaxID=930972 RepID=UPI002665F81A|nr:tRNA (adenosine(37)-N6)-threonylcarbamoyltransferase complex ATPase subunit type 1 TsaE [Porifericola rhodea]WKN32785.1 tRNA (adenosine(37)-N6)-threonylcarbamoyltransferase complex ATPase subunit type 1 TsaE [Porifericola rhodea]
MADVQEEIEFHKLEDAPAVAQKIRNWAKDTKVWLFYGDMGVGKTTLIKAICNTWGVADTVSSPTFALVNEYQNAEGQTFYHFDFYRINEEEEAWNIGTEDYFYSGNYCFVEWPERIESLLPEKYIRLDIKQEADQSRRIYLSRHE